MMIIRRCITVVLFLSCAALSFVSAAQKQLDVLGVGAACVDICIQCESEQEFLTLTQGINLRQGGSTAITEQSAKNILDVLKTFPPERVTYCAGGISANTVAGIINLGGSAGFVGATARDDNGSLFLKSMNGADNYLVIGDDIPDSTGITFSFITHTNGHTERTFAAHVGAASHIYKAQESVLDPLLNQTKVLFSEGVIWYNEEEEKTYIKKLFSRAKKLGIKVAFSLSSSAALDDYSSIFGALLADIDILFGNEHEMKALFQTDDLKVTMEKLQKWGGLAVITRGAQGVVVVTKEENVFIPAVRNVKVVDVTGAGDAFAAGFLYGYTHNESHVKSGRLGCLFASKIIGKIGARTNEKMSGLINSLKGRDE